MTVILWQPATLWVPSLSSAIYSIGCGMAMGDRIRLHADIAMGLTHSSIERQINRDTLLLLERHINWDGGSMS
jgi:hypothetical protein